jgi:acetolactate synthase-1/2/3 large subunit
MNCAQVLIEGVRAMGGRRIYGVIGTSNVAFVNALYDYRHQIRYISCRHEQVAASMADAEGRLTGIPGVVLTHAGPGALNAAISVAAAHKDASPMICLSGAVRRKLRGLDGMLEADHLRVFGPLCKGVWRIEEARHASSVFSEAWRTAVSGSPGPVFIEVPQDVWEEDAGDSPAFDLRPESPPEPPHHEVRLAVEALERASRPLILSGGGVAISGASPSLIRLAEALGVPVATTGNGRGTIPETHPLCLGRVGFGGGTTAADRALAEADIVLAVGCTISDMTTYEYTWLPSGEAILVNLHPSPPPARFVSCRQHLHADAGLFLKEALKQLDRKKPLDRSGWWARLRPVQEEWAAQVEAARKSDRVPLSPGRVVDALRELLPEEHIVTVGAGLHVLYPMAFLPCLRPRSFLSSVNFGAMGFGFAASLAAALVHPEKPVVAILGDGDFMMTLQDLETAVREGLSTKVLVVNDSMYRVLNLRQRIQHEGRILGSCHGNPDFAALARAFGAQGWRIERPEQIRPALQEALAAEGPAVVDAIVDPDDFPPANYEAALRMSQVEGAAPIPVAAGVPGLGRSGRSSP